MAPPKPDRRAAPFSVTPLSGMPLFVVGMNVAGEIVAAARKQGVEIGAGDVVVVAQKIVSKAEGRSVRLRDVAVSDEARVLAHKSGKAPALIQLMLEESTEIMRVTPHVVITRLRSGHVAANAGIDASNVEGGADDAVLLWPRDPDASARQLRAELTSALGVSPAVIIADSLGRAWRLGTMGTAIGCAGVMVIDDRRGEADLFGRKLQATLVGVADSIAAAAVLAMGEGAEGAPAAIVRGMAHYVSDSETSAIAGLRSLNEDLFR
ncbi:MAG: coenzyme F420-0:L-glutamate ligase [Hyphomonadaceae bacterium]|nr:coenzyme F420-0:L-glutamate ligase [Hyphomonadaceae bacterium]